MTTGEVLYLLMCIAMFTAFSGVLAWQSWLQSSHEPRALDLTQHTERHLSLPA